MRSGWGPGTISPSTGCMPMPIRRRWMPRPRPGPAAAAVRVRRRRAGRGRRPGLGQSVGQRGRPGGRAGPPDAGAPDRTRSVRPGRPAGRLSGQRSASPAGADLSVSPLSGRRRGQAGRAVWTMATRSRATGERRRHPSRLRPRERLWRAWSRPCGLEASICPNRLLGLLAAQQSGDGDPQHDIEVFAGRQGQVFDPGSAVEAAADATLSALFAPQRVNRLIDAERRDPAASGLGETVDSVTAAVFTPASGRSGRTGAAGPGSNRPDAGRVVERRGPVRRPRRR